MQRSRARSSEAINFARDQRATSNELAATIWQWIRNRQICKQKFRREYPFPPYTIDFCCVELKLIVEVDGVGHLSQEGQERDRVRDEFLTRNGFRVVRIAGFQVLREPDVVFSRITKEVTDRLSERSPSPPAPLPEAGRGE